MLHAPQEFGRQVIGIAQLQERALGVDARDHVARLDELTAFPNGTHDDQIDAVAEAIGAQVASKPLRIDVGAVWIVAEVRDARLSTETSERDLSALVKGRSDNYYQWTNNPTGNEVAPADVLVQADAFFPGIGLAQVDTAARTRTYSGPLGTLKLVIKAEGGHYTFVEANTDQMGESRLDRNAKRFFVALHRVENPSHKLEASY